VNIGQGLVIRSKTLIYSNLKPEFAREKGIKRPAFGKWRGKIENFSGSQTKDARSYIPVAPTLRIEQRVSSNFSLKSETQF